MPNYGDSAYWEQRYEQERIEHGHRYTYDWYFPWSTMETYIGNFCSESKSERVLIAGCGNSLWPEEMYESGFHNITCVDWSREVIGTMSTRNRSKQGMVYEHADVRRLLQCGNGSFDLVIDKACLDAVMCGYDGIKNADLYMQEVHRYARGYFFLHWQHRDAYAHAYQSARMKALRWYRALAAPHIHVRERRTPNRAGAAGAAGTAGAESVPESADLAAWRVG